MTDRPPVGDTRVAKLLPEHRDRAWRDVYGFEWQWVKWASQEWDWGMRDDNSLSLPWQRCFYDECTPNYRAPFTLVGPVRDTTGHDVCHSTHADPVATQPQPTDDCRDCTSTRAYCDALPGTCCTHCSHLATQPQPTDEPPRCDCGLPAASGSSFCSACSPICRHGNVLGAVAEIRALHRATKYTFPGAPDYQCCHHCTMLASVAGQFVGHPCATVRALDEAGCL